MGPQPLGARALADAALAAARRARAGARLAAAAALTLRAAGLRAAFEGGNGGRKAQRRPEQETVHGKILCMGNVNRSIRVTTRERGEAGKLGSRFISARRHTRSAAGGSARQAPLPDSLGSRPARGAVGLPPAPRRLPMRCLQSRGAGLVMQRAAARPGHRAGSRTAADQTRESLRLARQCTAGTRRQRRIRPRKARPRGLQADSRAGRNRGQEPAAQPGREARHRPREPTWVLPAPKPLLPSTCRILRRPRRAGSPPAIFRGVSFPAGPLRPISPFSHARDLFDLLYCVAPDRPEVAGDIVDGRSWSTTPSGPSRSVLLDVQLVHDAVHEWSEHERRSADEEQP